MNRGIDSRIALPYEQQPLLACDVRAEGETAQLREKRITIFDLQRLGDLLVMITNGNGFRHVRIQKRDDFRSPRSCLGFENLVHAAALRRVALIHRTAPRVVNFINEQRTR